MIIIMVNTHNIKNSLRETNIFKMYIIIRAILKFFGETSDKLSVVINVKSKFCGIWNDV